MTVVHIFASFPNPSQPYNKILISRLKASHVNCHVISFGKSLKNESFSVHSFKHYNYRWLEYIIMVLKNYKKFVKYKSHAGLGYKKATFYFGRYSNILNFSPDVVHVHHMQLLQPQLISFFESAKIKYLVSIRGSDVLVRPYRSKTEMDFILSVLQRITYVHAVSEHLKNKLSELTKKDFIGFVIHRTVEVDSKIDYVPTKNNRIKITTIGRLHWTKGYRLALEALFILKRKKIDFEYHICGSYTNEQIDELEFYINEMGLEKYVVFHGHLNSQKLDVILKETTIYLQTSLSEGIPNTLLRAIFYRIPVVTSNAGGIPEVVRNGKDGIMVEKGSSLLIAKAIENLVNDNELMSTIRESDSPVSADYMDEIQAYKAMYKKIIQKGVNSNTFNL